jgi:hypothetical protein
MQNQISRWSRLGLLPGIVGVLVLTGFTLPAPADELSDARSALAELGIRPTTTNLALESEARLHKDLGRVPALRRALTQAEKGLQTAEGQVAKIKQGLTALKQQHVVLSARLATVGPTSVTINNQLVGALNANQGQQDLFA